MRDEQSFLKEFFEKFILKKKKKIISRQTSKKNYPACKGVFLTAPNTTIARFTNTVAPDEPSHLILQCLPSSLFDFFADVILSSAFSSWCIMG